MNKQVLIGTVAVTLIFGGFFTYASLRIANAPAETTIPSDDDLSLRPVDAPVSEVVQQNGSAEDRYLPEEEDDDRDERSSGEKEEEDDDDTSKEEKVVPIEKKVEPATSGTAGNNTAVPVQPAVAPQVTAPSGITLAEVATHGSEASCWMVIRGKVYDVTSYIGKHPAGKSSILKGCGKEATSMFEGVRGHLKQATLNLLPGYYKGELAS